MAGDRSASRVVAIVITALAGLSVAALVTVAMLSAFVFDRYDGYGQVPIPGESTVYLPAGPVSISFATRTSGGGTALPPLHMNIEPPPGVPDPDVTEDHGGSVTIGDEVHRQVWRATVHGEGGYRITIDGPVGGYVEPRLAFGDTGSMDGPILVLAAVAFLLSDAAVAAWWLRRMKRPSAAPAAPGPSVPSDEGVRLEQLKTIAALRDSGALTESEFEAEKRRILEGR